MKIVDLLPEEAIITNVQAKNKREFIRIVSKVLSKCCASLREDEVFKVLMDREEMGTTGFGGGIAIPHGKLPPEKFFERPSRLPILLFARSLRGIDFDAVDSKPVNLFFVLLAPEDSASLNLKVLARVARLLNNDEMKERLQKAKTKQEVIEIIKSCEGTL